MNFSHLNEVSEAEGVEIGIVSPDGRDGMIRHAEQFVEAGIPFIFDPSQGLPMFSGDDLKRFISQATWMTVNDYEWELISERTGWTKAQAQQQLKALIITRGGEGSEIHCNDQTLQIPGGACLQYDRSYRLW